MKRYCDEHSEEWKDLVYMGVSYPEYEISSYGKLRNKATGKVRSTKITKGYVSCNIRDYANRTKSGKPKTVGVYIHRALAEAFIPNPNNYPVVNHKFGDKKDFDLYGLEWTTQRENLIHAKEEGLNKNYGETHGNAKLTDHQVEEIRSKQGVASVKELAIIYGVHTITIRRIWKSQTRTSRYKER